MYATYLKCTKTSQIITLILVLLKFDDLKLTKAWSSHLANIHTVVLYVNHYF